MHSIDIKNTNEEKHMHHPFIVGLALVVVLVIVLGVISRRSFVVFESSFAKYKQAVSASAINSFDSEDSIFWWEEISRTIDLEKPAVQGDYWSVTDGVIQESSLPVPLDYQILFEEITSVVPDQYTDKIKTVSFNNQALKPIEFYEMPRQKDYYGVAISTEFARTPTSIDRREYILKELAVLAALDKSQLEPGSSCRGLMVLDMCLREDSHLVQLAVEIDPALASTKGELPAHILDLWIDDFVKSNLEES